MSIVWIFLDGVGYGPNEPDINPWALPPDPTLIAVDGRPPSWPGAVWRPLDATLGIPGLPQSATGTTALLTGVNVPEIAGRHISGFPGPELRAIIEEHSVHRQALERGLKPVFANAYNEAYFRRPANRQSVTTHALRASGIPFLMMEDYREGRAVFHDLSGELVRIEDIENKLPAFARSKQRVMKRYIRDPDTFASILRELDLPSIIPEEGGERIARLADEHDLVLFEYLKTDMAGHTQDMEWAQSVIDEVMCFLRRLLELLTPSGHTLLIASDHGNSEDLSTKSHTRNPVPAVAVGPLADSILHRCERITDLTPAILAALDKMKPG